MSEPQTGGEAAGPAKEDPESLVLRGRPRPAVRFRRGLVIGIAGLVSATLVAVAWMALEPPSFSHLAEGEERDPVAKRAPDALAGAPSSYGDVPRLGPPLPGDLGRPILEHQRSLEAAAAVVPPASPVVEDEQASAAAEVERQRIAAAAEAARLSGLLVQLSGRERGAEAPSVTPGSLGSAAERGGAAAAAMEAAPAAPSLEGQARKIDFARSDTGDVSPHALRSPSSPWTLSAGTIIPASLVTGLNSDLPGMVLAQVTEPIRDSATGRTVLIPQGSRLIGSYDSVVAFGQRRALLVWERIVLPDGSSVRLDTMPATDAAGYAGVEDRVDFHTWRLLKGIAMATLLGVGTELSLGGGESDLIRAIRESTQQNVARAGDRMAERNIDVQPTLTVRPGWPLRAIVHKDLVLRPWKG